MLVEVGAFCGPRVLTDILKYIKRKGSSGK